MKSRGFHLMERSSRGYCGLGVLLLSMLTIASVTLSCGGRAPASGAPVPEPDSTQASLFTVPANQLQRLQIRPAQKRYSLYSRR